MAIISVGNWPLNMWSYAFMQKRAFYFIKDELHAGSTSLHYSPLLNLRYCIIIKSNFCMSVSV